MNIDNNNSENDQSRRIIITVVSPDRGNLEFNICIHSPLRTLMELYCTHFGLDRKELYFRTRGLLIVDDDTAYLLHIDKKSIIEVTDRY
ncbi:hypothetical protein KR038_001401 [Drosophila bunnanda]|nr:hypothetical protein KR038_001401 [Drosophila bunnanda]